jgi:hypothetical protein
LTAARAQEIIAKAAEERERFLSWTASVPDDAWGRTSPDGTWMARDYVAHLASIDPLITRVFRAIRRNTDPADSASDARRIDDWNEERILERRKQSLDQCLDEMARNRLELNAALADLTDEHLESVIHFAGDSKRAPRDIPLHLFLRGWVFHDRWHMEDARRAIDGEPEQPFGDEAFARAAREQAPS